MLAVLAVVGGGLGAWQAIPSATASPVAAPYNFVLDGSQDSVSGPATVNWSQILTHNTTSGSVTNQIGALPSASLPANYIADAAVPDYAFPDPTVFTSGSKDTLPISGWSCTTKSNIGAKDDLMNAYQTAYIEPAGGAAGASAGDLIVVFGADKSSDLGDNNFGLWLLQGQGKDSIGCSGGSFTGFHANGDLLLSAAFTNGGGTASIVVSDWTGCGGVSTLKVQCTGTEGSLQQLGTSGSLCQPGAGAILPPPGAPVAACAITNTGNVSVPWYAPAKTMCSNALCPEEFYEGALDVNQLLGVQGNSAGVPCFNNTITDTRSSQSPTATIFDYALGKLTTCGPPNLLTTPTTSSGSSSATSDDTSVAAIQVPIGSTLNDSATFTGDRGTVTGTVTFNLYKQLTAGAPLDCSGDGIHSQLVYTDTATLANGSANSDGSVGTNQSNPGGYQANQLATYSWQDAYTPAATAPYTARTETCGKETEQTVDARIQLTPGSASNLVGNVHKLTATVQFSTDDVNWNPVTPTSVLFGFVSGKQGSAHYFNSDGATGSANTSPCVNSSGTMSPPGSTDATTGSCNAYINDSTAEQVQMTASATNIQVSGVIGSFSRSTTGTAPNSGPASKQYIDARIMLTPGVATNFVGNVHTLTAEVDTTTNGSTWNPLSGALVNLSFVSGHQGSASFYSDATGATNIGSTAMCTTGANGKCNAYINDSTAETVDVNATVALSNSNPTGNPLGLQAGNTLTRSTGDSDTNDSANAQKTYTDARITLTPGTATNIVGNVHTLTVEVDTTTDGSTWNPLSGALVNLSFVSGHQGSASFYSDATGTTSIGSTAMCTTGANGKCNAFINDSTAETVDMNATVALSINNPTGNPLGLQAGNTLTRSTGDSDTNDSANAQKTYVQPGTDLSVTDQLVGLPSNSNGTVSYTAYSNAGCTMPSGGVPEGGGAVTSGTAASSNPVTVGPGSAWTNTTGSDSVYWVVHYTGNDGQTFTSNCLESATGH